MVKIYPVITATGEPEEGREYIIMLDGNFIKYISKEQYDNLIKLTND